MSGAGSERLLFSPRYLEPHWYQLAGIRTTCITSSRFKKGSPDISAGIAFKNNNVKSGRINQALTTRDSELPESVGEGGTMLVGIDVTHQAPGSMDGVPSIASVVASIDWKSCRLPGSLCCQENKEEIVKDHREMMKERLNVCMSKNANG
ncbi:hypothetical protein HO173_003365 [Letharia columbiana]|uniref:Piwi domain-containing protein n=1 Tax=Letharia columbiana TaxID=112416 RepID=A0A8H6G0S6_9LECA|nr:uncharacterized protein HO173_003365 [Letharia columbiana]KAF6238398.1 hypothetical protein HO173_003365 [Letharia columbiana]